MFKTSFTIEWGDCDEAGIVFYPNYFYWFDCTFQRFLRERGMGPRQLRERFAAMTPILEAHANFKAPARYDDTLNIELATRRDGERRFKVEYRSAVNGREIGTGYEVRAWVLADAAGKMKSAPFHEDFAAAIGIE